MSPWELLCTHLEFEYSAVARNTTDLGDSFAFQAVALVVCSASMEFPTYVSVLSPFIKELLSNLRTPIPTFHTICTQS